MSEMRTKELEFKLELLKELYKIASEQSEIKMHVQNLFEKQGDHTDELRVLLSKLNDIDKQLVVINSTLSSSSPDDVSPAEENIAIKKLELDNVKNKRALYLAVASAVISGLIMVLDKLF